MKKVQTIWIVIPAVCALLALNGCGMLFRIGVSASCAAILCLVYGKNIKKDVWLIVAAFLLSIVGDWFLSHRKGIPVRFLCGIIFFFAAHCGYLWFSLRNGKINKAVLSGTLAVYLAFFFWKLYPALDNTPLLIAVLGYLLISCISFAASTGIRFPTLPNRLFVAGIGCIFFSDTIIAFKEFVGYKELNFLIMPTYYLSHILITSALIVKQKK